MIDVPNSIVDDFVKTCHEAAGRGLVLCSSGNLSFRLDEARFINSNGKCKQLGRKDVDRLLELRDESAKGV